eukprot:g4789.t1
MTTLLLIANVAVCAFLALSSLASAERLRRPITPYKYRQLGFTKLGQGYWKKEWDFFYAKKSQNNPKKWTKLEVEDLKVLGSGYAIDPKSLNNFAGGKAFFRGEEFASGGRASRADGLKVLRFPDGKLSFWAVGKTGTIYYKGRRNTGIDGAKVKLIGHGWAHIAGRTFYHGNLVHGVAGKVKPHSAHYATDAIHAYYKGRKMDVAGQVNSFKILGRGYAGTQMFAFYEGEKVSRCVNPEEVMGAYLICMGGSVFFEGNPVQASKCINPKKYLGHGFLECFTTYLYNGQKLNGPSPQHNQLKITPHGTAVDKRGKEYGERIDNVEEDGVESKRKTEENEALNADAARNEKCDSLFGCGHADLSKHFK